jgi:hypothetical protein
MLAALLALPSLAHAQAPAASATETAPAATARVDPAPRRFLLKAGLTPSRVIPQYRSNGFDWKLAPSVGAEFLLAPHVTLYGQADVDFSLSRDYFDQYPYVGPAKERLVHSGAVGVGMRYYYNQAGRERRNRAHGPFVGNYIAVEAATELNRRLFYNYNGYFSYYPTVYSTEYRTEVMPVLTALWGMQRRLGQHFLYDASAGVALLARPVSYNYYGPDDFRMLYGLDASLAVNLRVYFVR